MSTVGRRGSLGRTLAVAAAAASEASPSEDELPERTPFGGWVYRTPDPNGHSLAVKMDGETRYIRYWMA